MDPAMHGWTMRAFVSLCLLASASTSANAQVKASLFVSGLSSPIEFVQDPAIPGVQLVLEQAGLVRVIHNGVLLAQPFLDLRTVVSSGGERGLLGLAFAPDYASSRRFFVNFTNLSGHTVVARFKRMANDPLQADPSSRFDLRWGGPTGNRFITQPYSNHNGGHLAFGTDGYLYIGMGDGGSGGDPENYAQTTTTLLGKMLRIDINVQDDHQEGYVVPANNPFVNGFALPEIWAFGLRNPWKFSVDNSGAGSTGTGAIVIGDVGQGAREEINYEPAGAAGRNYGWRLYEGTSQYLPNTPPAYLPLTPPIFDFPRTEGRSVTGGYVYRGSALISGFRGRYFYADFITGRVWSLGLSLNQAGEATVTGRVEHTAELGGTAVLGNISSMGVDSAGEIYVVSYHGVIHKIIRDPALPGPIAGAALPYGQLDTPQSNTGAPGGKIPVTGWALDDTGVDAVRVYRNCAASDVPGTCETVLGASVVLLGNAEFQVNTRPDVAAAFPSAPNSNRAGWSFQLPISSLAAGSVTLSAVARDLDGQLKLLGTATIQG
jgi:glucose/arabinose dehydrogenase